MSYAANIDPATIQQWIAARLEPAAIEAELHARGLDAESIKAHLQAFRKSKMAKRQFAGFLWTAIGAFLGFISCVLTLINPVPELYNIILFGLTSIAILVIFYGLYLIFE